MVLDILVALSGPAVVLLLLWLMRDVPPGEVKSPLSAISGAAARRGEQ